jgi:hypothetical protein
MKATPTTRKQPNKAKPDREADPGADRTQKCQVYVAPETCARPERARETTREHQNVFTLVPSRKKIGEERKKVPDIYTSESYFGKPTGRDPGVEVVICIRGGSLGARGPNTP